MIFDTNLRIDQLPDSYFKMSIDFTDYRLSGLSGF